MDRPPGMTVGCRPSDGSGRDSSTATAASGEGGHGLADPRGRARRRVRVPGRGDGRGDDLDIGDTPYCDEPEALGAEECYGGSKAEKTIALILGWPSAVAGFLVLPLAIYFAARGVRGRLVIGTAAVALALGGLSILIG